MDDGRDKNAQAARAGSGAPAQGEPASATEPTSQAGQPSSRGSFKAFALDFAHEFSRRHFNSHASSATYFYFLAIVPMFIFASALLPLTGMSEGDMVRAVTSVLPDSVSSLAATVIREAYEQSSTLIPITALTLLWTSIQGNMVLLRGMNNAYQVPHETRPYWKRLLIAFFWMTLLLVVFLVLLLLVFSGAIRSFLSTYLPDVSLRFVSRSRVWVVCFFFIAWLLVALSYWLMPNRKHDFLDQVPGALVTTVGWCVFSAFFSIYVNGVNKFTTFYGSLGTLAIALFWMYCCFYILLVGAFVNCYFEKDIHRATERLRARLHLRRRGR
ncbi:MAG: YihY/virulence factor BrkB family protein [Tractidigestivibacter sp.]|jgi:membrane protein|uniref:YihY/virulence factor BrkB family protein n=1 Tax=Tractidigestivibacter sp. TaxID=2847320 RepID=UPI003D9162CA